MIDNLLARPGQTYDTPNLVGNGTYGTVDSPQISHFTHKGGVKILGAGNVTGAGILIVDGAFTIVGTFNFKGLVLVRGEFTVDNDALESWVSGNATIYGSVWTESVKLKVGGSAIVNYSSQALSLANQTGGGSALPAPMRVTSLADCSQLVAGTGGCP